MTGLESVIVTTLIFTLVTVISNKIMWESLPLLARVDMLDGGRTPVWVGVFGALLLLEFILLAGLCVAWVWV